MSKEQLAINYLNLPTIQLLDEYGKGSHIPGSGSAAALSGLFAVEMMRTVSKLTIKKPKYVNAHNTHKYILERLENEFKPKLIELFNNDIRVFGNVSELRIARDKLIDKKERDKLNRQALELQKVATQIPIDICRTCISLIDSAFIIYDSGFKSARGDSGVAISNLLSAIQGSLFVVFLNFKSYRESKWLLDIKLEAEKLTRDYHRIQGEAFKRVIALYEEGLNENQIQLRFNFVQE